MNELLKPLASAKELVAILVSWGLPTLAAVAVYTAVVYPSIADIGVSKDLAGVVERAGIGAPWFFFIVSATLTIVLAFNSRTIYRVLEGILWPKFIRKRRIRTHTLQWDVLKAETEVRIAELQQLYASRRLDKAQMQFDAVRGDEDQRQAAKEELQKAQQSVADQEQSLEERRKRIQELRDVRHEHLLFFRSRRKGAPFFVLKSYLQYPTDRRYVMATKMGNRLRAMETYGKSRYGLDSQILWYDLLASVEKETKDQVQDARQPVDQYVSLLTVTFLLTAASILSALAAAVDPAGGRTLPALILPILCWPLLLFFYRRILDTIGEWEAAISALVNVGRMPLAKAYGLAIPASLPQERRMWRALTNYVYYGNKEWAAELDLYRKKVDDPKENSILVVQVKKEEEISEES
jgi:hypothetical protein